MNKNSKNIQVNDFNLFAEVIKSASKIVESAKITIDQNGMSIYGCNGKFTRCELMSNAISCDDGPIELCIEKLAMFLKIVMTVKEIQADDYSNFKFFLDSPKLHFESKKFKTKFQLQNDASDIIQKWMSTKIQTKLTPEFEFTTTSDLIRRVNNHQFIFDNVNDIRIYLELKDDMQKNTLFATLGNKNMALGNEMTLDFGIVTSGTLKEDRKLILDVTRLNIFNALQSNEIKIFLPEKYNMLVSTVKVLGKNDTYFTLNTYNALLKD